MRTIGHRLSVASEAKPLKKQHTKPCADCPWARASLPGWLGMMSVDQWLAAVHGEGLIDCHCVSNQQCAGSAIYRGNMCKSPRDPRLLVLPADRVLVFATPNEFRAHHGKAVTS